MRILVTNDDGIHSPGLGVAEKIARALSDDVWVIAPETEQSGASHSLTLTSPLRLRRIAEFFRVPPTTGEALALNKILDHAGIRYQPKPYGGDVALFQPADRPDALDYRPGWREVVRGAFASFEIDGTHSTMLEEPYVGELAARMSACLRRAQMQNRGQAPRRAAS